MKGKRSNTAGVIALLVIGAAGVYGLGAYLGKTPEAGQVASNIRRAEALEDHSKPEPPKAEETTAKVLTPVVDGENLSRSFTTLKFGLPAGLVLPDGQVYAACWCVEDCIYVIRWFLLPREPGKS